jgi:hypothetical protein
MMHVQPRHCLKPANVYDFELMLPPASRIFYGHDFRNKEEKYLFIYLFVTTQAIES